MALRVQGGNGVPERATRTMGMKTVEERMIEKCLHLLCSGGSGRGEGGPSSRKRKRRGKVTAGEARSAQQCLKASTSTKRIG